MILLVPNNLQILAVYPIGIVDFIIIIAFELMDNIF